MVNLCQYRDVFGQVGTGVHSYRLFDIAIVDLLATILLGVILQRIFDIKLDLVWIILLLILVSIPIHMLFCVETRLVSALI
jgi:hypothetical protein